MCISLRSAAIADLSAVGVIAATQCVFTQGACRTACVETGEFLGESQVTNTATEVSQIRAARLAGAMFLFINATGFFSEIFVRESLRRRDAAQVAQNIIDSERLYRLGIVGDLVMFTGVLVLIWALYVLLRPVNRDLAVLAALLRIIEVPVGVAATLNSLIAVQLLSSAKYLEVFEAGQLQALSRLARNAFGYGQDIGFIFVGLGSMVFAYLLLKSRYIPRILAWCGLFAGLLFTAYNFWIIVIPGMGATFMYASFAPIGIYEIVLGFWLLSRGAKIQTSGGCG